MKFIIFTNYFPPELGAASNRMFYLSRGLKQLGHDVEVIAPLPNYPSGKIFNGYKGKFSNEEKIDDIKVKRYWIYATNSKKASSRILGMLSFAVCFWSGFFYYLRKKPDIILVQHSPLLVSFSALLLSRLIPGCKRVLNVSDLWPLSALELGAMKPGFIYNLMEKIEYANYRNSHLILGQSKEILQHVSERCKKPMFLYRNISPQYSSSNINLKKNKQGQMQIVYAGLLGVAQGIYNICKNIDFKKLGIDFHIYGGGNEENDIKSYIQKNKDCRITYHGSIPQNELYAILPKYHASIVPLANRIYGAVPSKIFELCSLGIVILFCGGGEGAEIVSENKIGFISEPADYISLEENIKCLKSLDQNQYEKILLNCKSMTENLLNYQKQLNELNIVLDKLVN